MLVNAQCPECQDEAALVNQCRVMTTKYLPFVSRPRLLVHPEPAKWRVVTRGGLPGGSE